MAQTSYSLPPTPIASSFEESAPSTKRRKSQRPVDLKDSQPEKITKTPVQKKDDVPASESKSDAKSGSRNRKSGKLNGHAADAGDSHGHQLTTHTTSNAKRKAQAPPSKSNLHASHKDPRMKRKSLATEAELANASRDRSGSTSSTMAPATTQNDRKARKSMPAKLNGVSDKKETVHPKSADKPSASRPSTPARIDRKAKPTSQASAKATKSANKVAQVTSTAKPATPVTPKTEKAETADSTTPAAQANTNPRDSTARSRRRDRKSKLGTDRNLGDHIQVSSTKHNHNHNPPVRIHETPSQPPSVPDPTLEAAQPLSHNINTRSSRAKTAAKLLAVDKPLESPATLMVLETTPYNGEVADSVEGTPVQAYRDNFHFEYGPEMYGNRFGLDGQVDGPGSPTSLSTGTSAAARTSSRIRKPTMKALESLESERQFRRSRAPSSKPESTAFMGQKKGGAAQPEHQVPASAQASAAQQPDTAFIARRLLELAVAAVSADPALDAGLDARLESLRKEFEAEQRGQDGEGAGSEGESRPTSSLPFGMDKTKVSEPWTDEDGWTHTGLLNKFGEEYVFVSSDFEWVHPTNTYGDDQLPQPPGRFRSREQAEKDRIFGYPPRLGERNLPQQTNLPFRLEDVDEEKAKVKARDAARLRGIPVDRTMSAAEIEALIAQHDNAGQSEPAKEEKPASGSRKRRRTEPVNATPYSTSVTKRRRQNPSAPSPAAAAEKPSLTVKFRFSNPEKAAAVAGLFGAVPSSPSKKRLLADAETDGDASSAKKRKSSPATANPAELNQTPNGRPRRRAATALMADFQSHAEERARRAARKKATTPSKQGGGSAEGVSMRSA
ncbi:hypothetical protein IFM61392_01417 [Aspergillus lentulus]|uniref:GPI-anchored cell surface glycoprotein n=1 Tax=Aspergillus lentulus TaxID=293939 RepID=A0ABQ1A106_ASPLE|nr:hypothetical protein IFM62136_02485 [Aspergillus lentulus]GFF65735.1 hypothetical protein IFM47457_01138 [Aspergillus lentulus]GFF68138.1 hypothetical protein IFM60648_02496 [Aspergillus lentulus]GFG00516.1 hypothetical protein IFM61392_01417 [Aspergillus lentulus]